MKVPVKIGSEHKIYETPKSLYAIAVIVFKAVFGFIGVYISIRMYKEALHCTDCNNIVITHFSIIALCCLSHIGLQIEKVANLKVT